MKAPAAIVAIAIRRKHGSGFKEYLSVDLEPAADLPPV
jgi:hypothetical protein